MLPQVGSISMLGARLPQDQGALRKILGVTFQSPSVDIHLTVSENLAIHAALYGREKSSFQKEIPELLNRFLLAEYSNRRVGELSGGQRRKLELAKVFLCNPKILLLDEPTTGLDPSARQEFWELLFQFQKEKKLWVIVSTHLMEEAELCEEVLLLSQGSLKGQGTPETLRASLGYDIFEVETWETGKNPAPQLDLLENRGFLWRYRVQNGREVLKSFLAPEEEKKVRSLRLGRPTMSDVYFKYCGSTLTK
jgi:ABC-2 type transport system ATP-binding protein